ncbi:Fur family transcriptional regulator [Stigmatella aurantiaca]|uniref:Ferric uptake regulator, FUR family n=1 Tax=Stigmatella aurantiaca (strain DW4/3-1) TaxID=378806 RepID=Q091P3_STIAD|nr:transcriptional repressor [Stigmatella aurantiaca]ADO68657.1 Ferric uptake trancriptional regulator, FUR family [Stigmatella aurantiaca DW4/3-1]EAU66443.1 ferric uptake regulator, FUR family [Stigmatella aurantiaca DW4/3-1]
MGAKKSSPQPKLAELQQKIRAVGLRSTSPRVAVLRELEAASAPLSHADLVDALGEEGFDRVTLYRNLTDLTEAGLVLRSDLGDHVWRFELRRAGKEHQGFHAHFTCTDCGTVACLPEDSITLTPVKGTPRAVAARAVEVQLRGLCDRCD